MLQLRFQQDLYDEAVIRESAAAYGSLATFAVTAAAGEIEVSLSDIRQDVAGAIEDEFCNHVLAGTIRARRDQGQA